LATRNSYYVSVTGDLTVIGWTDGGGVQQILELPTEDAHEFFRRGELATREPARVGGALMKKMQMGLLRKRMFSTRG
jgi:hypothetical protein